MANISSDLKLSRRYTNHCIRVTTVTVLKENGYSNSDICKYTGHKNPSSVDGYSRKRRDEDFAEMSSALQQGCSSSHVSIQKVSKKSRISIITTEGKNCEGETSNSVININFNGTFNNCQIYTK